MDPNRFRITGNNFEKLTRPLDAHTLYMAIAESPPEVLDYCVKSGSDFRSPPSFADSDLNYRS